MKDNKKSLNILFLLLVVTFGILIVFSYYNFFIKGNYYVTKQVPCDPHTDSCFVSDCQANDSSCDPNTTYKKIMVLSKYAGNDYVSLSCLGDSPVCKIITCQQDTIEDGEKCFK